MFFLTTVTPLCYGMFFPVSEDKNSKYPKGYVLWSVLLTIWSVLLTFLDWVSMFTGYIGNQLLNVSNYLLIQKERIATRIAWASTQRVLEPSKATSIATWASRRPPWKEKMFCRPAEIKEHKTYFRTAVFPFLFLMIAIIQNNRKTKPIWTTIWGCLLLMFYIEWPSSPHYYFL